MSTIRVFLDFKNWNGVGSNDKIQLVSVKDGPNRFHVRNGLGYTGLHQPGAKTPEAKAGDLEAMPPKFCCAQKNLF